MDTRQRWRGQAFEALADAIVRGPEAPVAAYPCWSVADLAVHVVRILGNATIALRSGVLERPSPELEVRPEDAPDTLVEGLRDAVGAAEGALAGAAHTLVWTPVGARAPGFWARRLLREAVLHRWDAEHAQGAPAAVPVDVACDLIDEFVDTDVRRAVAEGWQGPGAVVLDAGAQRWRIDGGGSTTGAPAGGPGTGGEDVSNEAGSARIGGDAETLWLWLMRREGLSGQVAVDEAGGAASAFVDLLDGLKRPAG